MKTNFLFLMLLTVCNLFAQKFPRETLFGKVVTDSSSVENILITNKTANLSAVSRKDGSFEILVRVKDTLVFSGMNVPSQKLILNDADLKFNLLTVKIEVRANVLDEVIINPNALTGNLNQDSNNIKITQINPKIDNNKEISKLYLGDEKTSPENKLMPGYLETTYMMDFKALGGKLIHLLKKKDRFNSEKENKKFATVVKNRFSEDFFKNNFKLDKTQTTDFLNYCQNDPRALSFIDAGKDFELIEFLYQKREAYKMLKKE